MSFVGTSSFGNYDRTAQNAGLPTLARPSTRDHGDDSATAGGSSPIRPEDVSRTRATSTTEVAESETPRHEKTVTPGADTDTFSDDDDEDQIEIERRHTLVQALARKYTAQSHAAADGSGGNIFLIASEDENSPLNPNGPNFDARAWAKAVVDMVAGEGHQFRTTGVAFQHLNVYGFGSATDYQKDFLNIWLEVVGVARKLLGDKGRRIDILRDFNGLVRRGEMLVVLGPPGSGCSTFLKTIAGDHNGIFIDEKSYFNYQGGLKTLTPQPSVLRTVLTRQRYGRR